MRKLFWMSCGAALGVAAMLKGRQLLHKLTPEGVAEQVEAKGQQAVEQIGDFFTTYRSARDARAQELSGILITQPEIDRP